MSGGKCGTSNGAKFVSGTEVGGLVEGEGAKHGQTEAGCLCVECRSVRSETLDALRKKSPDKSMRGSGPLTPAQRAKLVHNALGEFGPWSSRYNGRYRFPGGAEAATDAVAAEAIPRQTTPAAAQ